jgi:hypothetical protein
MLIWRRKVIYVVGKGFLPTSFTAFYSAQNWYVGRWDIKDAEGAFEDLHVHITADTIEKVEAAVALIEPLLTPVDVS